MKRLLFALLTLFAAASGFATSSNAILLPAVGSIDGAGGVRFESDVSIHNVRNATQRLRLEWLPRSGSGQVTFAKTYVLLAGETLQSDDFVFNVMSTTGLGAVLVQPVQEDDSDDLEARLIVSSRIWSPAPAGGAGQVSQSFPPIALADVFSEKVAIAGMRRDDHHRVNVGIVNLDRGTAQRFLVRGDDVAGTDPIAVTVEPFSMQQLSLPGGPVSGRMRVRVEIVPAPGEGTLTLWLAYASTVDNRSGDSWSSIGVNTFP